MARDKHYDPDGWKKCTLRHEIEVGQGGLWLICGTCRKYRYFDIREWASEYGVDLDIPFKTLGTSIRCRRCGTLGVSAYAEPYGNLPPRPPAQYRDSDPICPECRSSDVHQWPLRTTDYPPGVERRFMPTTRMITCGCDRCDNWWTQPKGISPNAEIY